MVASKNGRSSVVVVVVILTLLFCVRAAVADIVVINNGTPMVVHTQNIVAVGHDPGCPACVPSIELVDVSILVGQTISNVVQKIPYGWQASSPMTAGVPGITDDPNIPNLRLTYVGGADRVGLDALIGDIVLKPGFTLSQGTFVGHGIDAATHTLATNVGSFVPQNPVRQCSVGGVVAITPPGGTAAVSETLNVVYNESGPFQSATAMPFTMSAGMSTQLPNASIPWLYGPPLHTMGFNEGPDVAGAVGDAGNITIDFGPCGKISDSWSVTGVNPSYAISHTLSGNLNLSSFGSLPANTPLARDVTTTFRTNAATGTVTLSALTSPVQVLCTGQLTATYKTHPTVALPAIYQSHLEFTGMDPASGTITGTRTRTVSATVPVPASSPLSLALAIVLLLGAGLFLVTRRRARAGAHG
jgi:hypothetical protein